MIINLVREIIFQLKQLVPGSKGIFVKNSVLVCDVYNVRAHTNLTREVNINGHAEVTV